MLQVYESLLLIVTVMLPPVTWPLLRITEPAKLESVKPAKLAFAKGPFATLWMNKPFRTPAPRLKFTAPVWLNPPKGELAPLLFFACVENEFRSICSTGVALATEPAANTAAATPKP